MFAPLNAQYSHRCTGNDVSRVQFEITSIEELLEEQPDSKCMPSPTKIIYSTDASFRVHGVSGSLQANTGHQTCGDSGKGGRAIAGRWLLRAIGEASDYRSAQTEEI